MKVQRGIPPTSSYLITVFRVFFEQDQPNSPIPQPVVDWLTPIPFYEHIKRKMLFEKVLCLDLPHHPVTVAF